MGKYSDNNPKSEFGNKKSQMAWIPSIGLRQQAGVHENGGMKYGPYNWRGKDVEVSAMVYASAILRHFYDWLDGIDTDADSGYSPLGHIAANCNILMDAAHNGNLKDDRPKLGSKVVELPTEDQFNGLDPAGAEDEDVIVRKDTDGKVTMFHKEMPEKFINGEYYPDDPLRLPSVYQRLMMTVLLDDYTLASHSHLILGLGPGAIPRAIRRLNGANMISVVENDKAVCDWFIREPGHECVFELKEMDAMDAIEYYMTKGFTFGYGFLDIYGADGWEYNSIETVALIDGLCGLSNRGVALNFPVDGETDVNVERLLKHHYPIVVKYEYSIQGTGITSAVWIGNKRKDFNPFVGIMAHRYSCFPDETELKKYESNPHKIGVWQPK